MKQRKLFAWIMATGILVNALVNPVTSNATTYQSTENTEESQKEVSSPYENNLSQILLEQKTLQKQREECDAELDSNTAKAYDEFDKMNQVSIHLNEQYEKYSDYGKLKKAKEKTDRQIREAKSLLMSTNGAYNTNEYKYDVEIAPDQATIKNTREIFDEISSLAEQVEKNDMTVKKFRGYYDIGEERETIVTTALNSVGKIRYQWGAKATSKDMPTQLDCSGFVQWVYYVTQDEKINELGSTMEIAKSYDQISKSDLKPGDIGMKNAEGTCYFDAEGNVYYSKESAVNSNIQNNKQVDKELRVEEKKNEKNISKLNSIYEDERKNLEDKLYKVKNKICEAETKRKKDKKQLKHLKEREKVLTDKMQTIEDVYCEDKVKEEGRHNEMLGKLESKFVDENDVKEQIGHVGIYAGKDENGKDTWIHCTGGSTNNVVLTTEDEYDGFKYFYSPLKGTSDASLEKEYVVNIPELDGYTGNKTYERYTAITSKTSVQYKLQQSAETDADGFRKIDGRYMIAVGSGISKDIGRYVDLVLENGTVIPCVIGDAKADGDTDEDYHIMTKHSCCVSEFICDGDKLCPSAKQGNVSNYKPEWNSPVKKIIVYNLKAKY